MSWLFKSLQPDGDAGTDDDGNGGGVKEDLSVIGETIGRQLRGVAAFLAPPPQSPTAAAEQEEEVEREPQSDALLGIRNDLAEIGGSFKSSLSLLSGNKAVSEISRFASSFWQFENQNDHDDDDEEDGEDGIPGITEEIVDFVKEISNRTECWTDFPLSLSNDFKMSDAQKEHASTIEQLVPSFAALKVDLQSYMGLEDFWMIYFILLLPRLGEQDFESLATPEVVETRDVLLRKLKNEKQQVHTPQESSKVVETQGENFPSGAKNAKVIKVAKTSDIVGEEDAEQWLEETDDGSGTSAGDMRKVEHEDVSFSDLEDDDSSISGRVSAPKSAQDAKASSPSGSNDWVQLGESSDARGSLNKAGQSNFRDKESEGEESSDWLNVDDFD